jgi:hypothetical protein
VSPRKSSTSSGRPPTRRPRYLGIEAAGEHLPPLPPAWWERSLRSCLDRAGLGVGFRLVRADARRALVEVEHLVVPPVRTAWTTSWNTPEGTIEIETRRTWGTVRGGKAWLREARRRSADGTAQVGANENVATSTVK